MNFRRFLCLMLITIVCPQAWSYYGPSIGRFINRDPIEEKGGLNLYAFARNQGVNATDYLGMDIILGIRVGSTVTDPGHVMVGVTAGNNVRVFDWQATGGASNILAGFGNGDASVDSGALSVAGARNLNDFLKSRTNYTFYRLATDKAEDVLALARAYELRDLANASNNDTLYDILIRTCGDTSCEVIHATGNPAPGDVFTPAQYRRRADRLSQPGVSGWIRIRVPTISTTIQSTNNGSSSGAAPQNNVYGESDPNALQLPTFTAIGTAGEKPPSETVSPFITEWDSLQNTLGRRPTQSDWWNRDFVGGAPGSIRERAASMVQEMTPEEVIEEERQKQIKLHVY